MSKMDCCKGKKALITGVTGQDGALLSEYLLSLGYEVHGLKRRASQFNTDRVDHLYQDPHMAGRKFYLHYADLTDSLNITSLLQEIAPDEIYNLAAQSHVKVSFEMPLYTSDVVGQGALRLLEAIRLLGMEKRVRYYQASTSELFGKVQEIPQNEKTPFYPRSPYAVAKLYAYWITVNYREAYGLHASNGILFNHESPLRGETFVTRKVTIAASKIAFGLQDRLYLGNLSARRDWGHAKDYVRSMHLILQQETPDDYVIATGHSTSVRDFATKAFASLGLQLEYLGQGLDEVGVLSAVDKERFAMMIGEKYLSAIERRVGDTLIAVDPAYFRPAEVEELLGDPTKAKRELGWEPHYTLEDLIQEMIASDVKTMKKNAYLKEGGYEIYSNFE
ncbi:GDP-mannose 4,6-dehydratase [Bacteroidales bacterium KA00251]|nr:GDP-mannose 4,6-dehydratase [Bacteroidales bacterium KA00251]